MCQTVSPTFSQNVFMAEAVSTEFRYSPETLFDYILKVNYLYANKKRGLELISLFHKFA